MSYNNPKATPGNVVETVQAGVNTFATATTGFFSSEVTGDAFARFAALASGAMQFGSGAAVADVEVYRPESNAYAFGTDTTEAAANRFLEIRAAAAPTSFAATAAAGTDVFIQAQDGGGAGNRGGDINMIPGAGVTTGRAGNVVLSRVRVNGANTANFLEMSDGQNDAVSAASEGRLRYNANTQKFEVSTNGTAYAALSTGSGGGFPVSSTAAGTPIILTSASTTVTGAGNTIAGGSGTLAATLTSGTNNVLIGSSVDVGAATVSNAIAIGNTAVVSNGCITIGNAAGHAGSTGLRDVIIGNTAGTVVTGAADDVIIGDQAGKSMTTSNTSVVIGSSAGAAITTVSDVVFIGFQAATASTGAGQSVIIGSRALGVSNTLAIGNVVIIGNSACGVTAGLPGPAANGTTVVGDSAGSRLQNRATIFGGSTGQNITSGANNDCLGFSTANTLTTGASNVIIGSSADVGAAAASNVVVIGNSATAPSGGTVIGFGAGTAGATSARLTSIGNFTARNLAAGSNDNTFVGDGTGRQNTTGNQNTYLGSAAGNSATTGSNNTCVGFNAGTNSTGGNNTFVGSTAGAANTTASNNTFVGSTAGAANTTGTRNTFLGFAAGNAVVAVSDVTCLGYQAGLVNTAAQNTFIGSSAGVAVTTGVRLVMLGYQAGNAFVSGADSTFIGYQAGLTANTGGTGGTAATFVGSQAGKAVTTGDGTFLGAQAGVNVTSGNFNTLIGKSTAGTLTTGGAITGGANVVVGDSADVGVAGTIQAVCIGASAVAPTGGTVVGYLAGLAGTTASHLTAIGRIAAAAITTGADNVFVGDSSANAVSGGTALTTGSQNTLVGSQTAVNAAGTSNACVFGFASRGAASSIIIGASKTSAVVNDFIIESGDVGLRRVAASVLQPTDGAGNPAWIQNSGGDSHVANDFNVTNSAVLVNVTGLTATVQAGRFYRFRAVLQVDVGTGGSQFAIGGTATATTTIYEILAVSSTGVNFISARQTALGGASSATGVTSGASFVVYIDGSILVNAGGTLTVQFAQNTSSGAASTVKALSTFSVWDSP